MLDKDNTWYCPKCKDHKQATLQSSLQETPTLLIVHLKRFRKGRAFYTKNSEYVDCPLNDLDLANYTRDNSETSNSKYDLYAVINHYGDTGGGHYTAFVKEKDSGKWFEFDDSDVSQIKSQADLLSNAYVLFYRKKSN